MRPSMQAGRYKMLKTFHFRSTGANPNRYVQLSMPLIFRYISSSWVVFNTNDIWRKEEWFYLSNCKLSHLSIYFIPFPSVLYLYFLSYPIPSHPIISHHTLSHSIPSDSIPSHPVPPRPAPSRLLPSHLIPSFTIADHSDREIRISTSL